MSSSDVPQLGFGTASLGGMFEPLPAATATEVLQAAYDRGIRWFDTAPMYGNGTAERRLAHLLDTVGTEGLTISTKVGRLMRPLRWPGTPPQDGDMLWRSRGPYLSTYDYTYDGLRRSVEDSLQRLGVDNVDALFIHDIGRHQHGDRNDHYLAQLRAGGYRALTELRDAGVTGSFGVGVNEVDALRTCLADADPDCCLLANQYTLLTQPDPPDVFDECRRRGVRLVAGGMYNSGVLAGGDHFVYVDAPDAVRAHVAALAATCAEFRVPLKAAAAQFVVSSPWFACVLIGARSVAELDDTLEMLAIPVPDELWAALAERGLVDQRWLPTDGRAA